MNRRLLVDILLALGALFGMVISYLTQSFLGLSGWTVVLLIVVDRIGERDEE